MHPLTPLLLLLLLFFSLTTTALGPPLESCPQTGTSILLISDLETFESSESLYPGNSTLHFNFRNLMIGTRASCSRDFSPVQGTVKKMLEPGKTTRYEEYHGCSDGRVKFVYGEVGGVAVTEVVECNGQNQTIYGGGKIAMECVESDRGIWGKGTACFYRDGPTALQMTGYIEPAVKAGGPGRPEYPPMWVG